MNSILIVDDTPANLQVLLNMLEKQHYDVRPATDGAMALEAVKIEPPDLILLDVMMPGMSGYDVCASLKADPQLKDIPVIFVSALDETLDKVRAFRVGAVDYITKPFQVEEVLARIETQLTLSRQHQQIVALSRLKDEMIRIVSHDLKNPLNNITNVTYLLQENGCNSEEKRQRYLAQIDTNAHRMLNLIESLLNTARIEQGLALQREEVLVGDILRSVLNDFELAAEQSGIRLCLQTPPFALISIDTQRMMQVLHNLVSNALKYTLKGGAVELGAKVTESEVLLYVSDNGLGIPEEDIPYLFEKFYRVSRITHRTQEGTGLGLAIAKAVVEQHGGSIWVESVLNEGSTFYVGLPLVG